MSTKYWIFKMYGIYAKMRERERERWATRLCICIFVKIVLYYNFTYIRHLLTFSCLRVLYRNSTVEIIKCCFDDQQFKVKDHWIAVFRNSEITSCSDYLLLPNHACARSHVSAAIFSPPSGCFALHNLNPLPIQEKILIVYQNTRHVIKKCVHTILITLKSSISSQVTVYNQ